MADEMRVEAPALLSQTCRVIPPVLQLPVDLGHVTGMVVAGRDWLFRPRLVGSGFCRPPAEVGVNNG